MRRDEKSTVKAATREKRQWCAGKHWEDRKVLGFVAMVRLKIYPTRYTFKSAHLHHHHEHQTKGGTQNMSSTRSFVFYLPFLSLDNAHDFFICNVYRSTFDRNLFISIRIHIPANCLVFIFVCVCVPFIASNERQKTKTKDANLSTFHHWLTKPYLEFSIFFPILPAAFRNGYLFPFFPTHTDIIHNESEGE